MAKYAVLLYAPARRVPSAEVFRALEAIADEAERAGVARGRAIFAPASAATTVLVRNRATSRAHGGVAVAGPDLAGCCVLECRQLDEALAWAARLAEASGGPTEVRAVLESEAVRDGWAIVERMVDETRGQRAADAARREVASSAGPP